MDNDQLFRGHLPDQAIRFAFINSTFVVNEAVLRHKLDPVSSHLLCRSMSAALLTSVSLNENEQYFFRWDYSGKAKSILVHVNELAETRGFISDPALSGVITDESDLFGESSRITRVKSIGSDTLSQGTTDSRLNDPVKDLAFGFSFGDQIETELLVLVGFQSKNDQPVRICQGVFLQAMPGCDLEYFEQVRTRLNSEPIRDSVANKELDTLSLGNLLRELCDEDLSPDQIKLHQSITPVFRCTCSHDKMGAVVRSLPYNDRMDVVKKKETLVVRCHYCSKDYKIDYEECIELWHYSDKPPSSSDEE